MIAAGRQWQAVTNDKKGGISSCGGEGLLIVPSQGGPCLLCGVVSVERDEGERSKVAFCKKPQGSRCGRADSRDGDSTAYASGVRSLVGFPILSTLSF